MLEELRAYQAELEVQNEDLIRTREEVEVSRDHLLALFRHAPVGYVILDHSGIILDANEAFLSLTGWEADELHGSALHDLLEEEDQALFQSRFKALRAHPRSPGLELSFQTRAGDSRHVILETTPTSSFLHGTFSESASLLVTVTDITHRRDIEADLRLRTQEHEALLSTSLDGFWLLDPEGRILEVNEAYCQMTGFSREEILGSPVTRFEVLESPDQAREHFRQVRERGFGRFETIHRTRGGTVLNLEVSATHWPEGNRFLAFLRDVTEQKKRQEQLRESESRFRNLLEAAPLSVMVVQDGKYVFCNPEGTRMLGHESPDEITGTDALETVAPEQRKMVMERMKKAGAGASNPPMELKLQGADGKVVWSWSRSVPITFDGRPSILIAGQDITERKKAEEALNEATVRMESAVRAGRVGLWDWDLGTDEVWFSEEWKQQIGYQDEEIPNRFEEWESRVHPEDVAAVMNVIHGALKSPSQDWEVEFRFRHRDGSWRWILAHASIIRDSTGTPVKTLGSHVDITDRKAAEEALRRSEGRYRDMFEKNTAVKLIIDFPSGRILEANPAALAYYGYSREEFLAKHIWDINTLGESETRRRMEEAQERNTLEFEFQHRLSSGEIRDVKVYSGPVEIGDRPALHSIVEDITDRKRAEEALKASEREKRLILNSTSEMCAYYDLDLKVIWANEAAARSVGCTPEDLVGRSCFEIWHGRDTPCEDCPILEVKKTGHPAEGPITSPDGRHWLLRGYPVLDQNGDLEGLVEFGQDVTEERKLAQERAALETQFQQVQKLESIGRLAGGIAHDLNNLLSPILGYGEMLLDDLETEDERRVSAEAVVEAGEKARDLVRQLLTFSRKQVLEFAPLDLNRMLLGFRGLLRRTIREDVTLEFQVLEEPIMVMGDMGQLEQVIMNLAANAQDAMPDGGTLTFETSQVTLSPEVAERPEGLAPGPFALLRVTDTGDGMSPDTLEHLFEPFFTTKTLGRGTGLGLSTVYGLVRQHGGTIMVHTQEGSGSTFEVYLPLGEKGALRPQAPVVNGAKPTGFETVLLVEDHDAVRRLAQTILERQGYEVLVARDGREALSRLEGYQGALDLLLTDVVMPEMNGKELFDAISRDHPETRVLYMSGHTDDAIVQRGVLLEGIHFLQKPFDVQRLSTKVREVLEGGE